MDKRYIIALEFSGSQIRGIAATIGDSSMSHISIPSVEAIANVDNVNCVQYGRVTNLIDAAKQAGVVIQKLENHTRLKGGKINSAYVALGGRSMGSVRTTAELELPSQMEITDDVVRRLLIEATKSISGDKKVLKVIPRKFSVDNQSIPNPIGSLGSKIKAECTVITCNPANKKNLEMVMNDRMRLHANEYVVTPLAIADMVLGEEEKQRGCALVDVGAQTTTISIYKDRALQHLATLPLGSRHITHDIALGLNATDEWAEMAKCNQGDALPESPATASEESAKVNCYVQARVGEIIANLIAQIGYAGFKTTDLGAGFIITGRGTKLHNFAQALEAQSKMRVRKASIPGTVALNGVKFDAEDYMAVIAIVLRTSQKADCTDCVTMPDPQQAQQAQEAAETVSGHYVDDDGDNDDYVWILDEEKERAKKAKLQAEKQRKMEQERIKKEKAEAARRARELQELQEQEELNRPKKRGFLSSIRSRFESILSYDPDKDDTSIE